MSNIVAHLALETQNTGKEEYAREGEEEAINLRG